VLVGAAEVVEDPGVALRGENVVGDRILGGIIEELVGDLGRQQVGGVVGVRRLSLLTGEPAAQNPSELRRDNRSQPLSASQPLTFTASAPGFITETFTITLTIESGELFWFMGTTGRVHPADPQRAYLLVTHDLVWPPEFRPDTALEEPFWRLTLPDGSVVGAVIVDENPATFVTIAFEVPADFTAGTITVGGVHTFPDTNDTWNFGSNLMTVAVDIPPG